MTAPSLRTPTRTPCAFAVGVNTVVCAQLRSLSADGTTGISRDNLWQLVAGRLAHLDGSPAGTNAAWSARQVFNEVCDHLSKPYAMFLIP